MAGNKQVNDIVAQAFDRAMPQVDDALRRARESARPEDAERAQAATDAVRDAVAQLRTRITSELGSDDKLDMDRLLGSVVGLDDATRASLNGMDPKHVSQAVRDSVRGAVDRIVASARANPSPANVNRQVLDDAIRPALAGARAPVDNARRQVESAVAALA